MRIEPTASTAPRTRARRARAALAVLAAAAIAAGCATRPEDITVSSAGLSDDATYLWLASATSGEKERFATTDEKATLHVRLAPNLIAFYKWFAVEWVGPHGAVYLRRSARTRWGSHQELTTEMRIRGEAPSRQPGSWKVRLYQDDRLLVERGFAIEGEPQPMPATATAGAQRGAAPAVAAGGCPPLPRPPGRCVDVAPQEIGAYFAGRAPETAPAGGMHTPDRAAAPPAAPAPVESQRAGAGAAPAAPERAAPVAPAAVPASPAPASGSEPAADAAAAEAPAEAPASAFPDRMPQE